LHLGLATCPGFGTLPNPCVVGLDTLVSPCMVRLGTLLSPHFRYAHSLGRAQGRRFIKVS